MAIKYKLKPDARKFFDKQLRQEIKPMEWWNKNLIGEPLLDQVSDVHIKLGHEKGSTTNMYSWTNIRNGEDAHAEFHFTVVVNDIEHSDYEKVSLPYVMDEIQKTLDKIYFK